MFKISPLVRMSSGLVFLSMSILFLADIIGISPDNTRMVIDERRKFAEFLTIQVMKSMEEGKKDGVAFTLKVASERNEEILSSAIRKINGEIVFEVGDHAANWNRSIDGGSTSNYIQVPVFKDNQDWGRIELRYKPINKVSEYTDLPIDNAMLLTMFVGTISFLLYFLFLRRTLKHLDPSAVIPSRVKNAMNALSEGVIILDVKNNIILANSSFCEKIEVDENKIIGKKIGGFSWVDKSKSKIANKNLPWQKCIIEKKTVSSAPISFEFKNKKIRAFMVNVSIIEDEKGNINGVLCTFDDVTKIEEKNAELESALVLLKRTQLEINKKNEELSILASTDPLTECLNRRAFFEVVEAEFKEKSIDKIMSCIMLDIDFFKKVNDVYGHTVGDIVIRSLADSLKSTLRENDLLCRYGGEEFCVILRDTPADVARTMAERVRIKVEELRFLDSPATENMTISASFGVTDITFDANSVEELIDQADQALYASKENGRNCVTTWLDVINQEKQEDVEPEDNSPLENAPQIDLLTGLSGRLGLIQQIDEITTNDSENAELFAIILININMFKRINSSIGSSQGDILLQLFAARLSHLIRDTDILSYGPTSNNTNVVSRVGGDEFAILVKEFDNSSNIRLIAKRMLDSLSQPYTVSEAEIHLTFSMGVSIYPVDGRSSEELILHTEQALVRAKKEEGNTYRRYLKDVDETSKDTISLENELRNAIKNREFVLYYQPKINLNTNDVHSVEALVRWNHPSKGIVSPFNFIGIAENCGLIHEIGNQIMAMAFQQSVKWTEEGYDAIRVAINISALQLYKPNFLENTFDMLELYNCSPLNIEFELTETVLVENIEFVLPILEEIHRKGIKISIDDFGVGYSSLNYVKRLPVDMIKIDKSFVDDMCNNHDDKILVSAMIAMAHAMNLSVVAEGVETVDQLQELQNLKCDYVQGYYFSKPIEAKNISQLLYRIKQKVLAAAG